MKARLPLIAVAVAALLVGCVDPRESLPDGGRDGKGSGGTDGSSTADQKPSTGGTDGATDVPGGSDVASGPDVPSPDVGNDSPPTIDLRTDVTDTPMSSPDVAPDLPSDLAPTLKDNGAACGVGAECKTGNCVEGVCCDGACGSKCMSCLSANSGKPDGQCGAVKAGTAHGNDCAASDQSTCGQTGKCDGAGACQKFAVGTTCKGESCAVGSARYSPMSTCNAQGACAPMTQACGNNYKCASDGLRCRSNCGADTECVDAAHCDGSLCVVDVTPGAICSRSDECTSSLCSGRCCNPGTPCKCPQPNAMNVVRNAGLDTNLSGWKPNEGRVWDSDDADGCPFSGSLSLGAADGYLFQCVPVSPLTTVNFGAMVKVAEDGSLQNCQVRFTADPFCGGSLLPIYGSFDYNIAAGRWTQVTGTIQSPEGTLAAEVACSGFNFKVDRMYLTPAPGTY